jgi:hypothetical protein
VHLPGWMETPPPAQLNQLGRSQVRLFGGPHPVGPCYLIAPCGAVAQILLGRSTVEHPVDVDLAVEGPANKVSRKQASIKLKKDGNWYIKNLGKRELQVTHPPSPLAYSEGFVGQCQKGCAWQ